MHRPRFTIQRADERTTVAALAALYGRWPIEERKYFVREALDAAGRFELDLSQLVVAIDPQSHQILGAALAICRPGNEAVCWMPGREGAEIDFDVAVALIQQLTTSLDESGITCTVAFPEPTLTRDQQILTTAGIPRVADLCQLRKTLNDSSSQARRITQRSVSLMIHSTMVTASSGDHFRLRAENWQPENEQEFAQAIDAIQSSGADCPELGSIRTGEDVLASHAASRPIEPGLWRAYRDDVSNTIAGVILLSDRSEPGELEVVYLGVVPQRRRFGIAKMMLQNAQQIAVDRGRKSLIVAVESRNKPALKLYEGEEFIEYRRYGIHLRVRPDGLSRIN